MISTVISNCCLYLFINLIDRSTLFSVRCYKDSEYRKLDEGVYLCMRHNVRRYVALAQSRGGARFCTHGAMQGYDVITLFSRWQKP